MNPGRHLPAFSAAAAALVSIVVIAGCGTANTPVSTAATNAGKSAKQATTAPKPAELTPEQAVGTIQTSYNNLNVHATEADVQRALQPVPVSEYTAREAAVEFGRKLNVFYLGGSYDDNAIDDSGNRGDETPTSKKQGDEILANIFGSDEVYGQGSSNYDQIRSIRTDLAALTDYFDNIPNSPSATPGKGGRFYNAETKKYEFATANTTYNVVSLTQNNTGYDATTENVYSTNLGGIDTGSAGGNILVGSGSLTSVKETVTMQLIDRNGEWQIGVLHPEG